ncbi:unnamed protein product, partial [Chrysoparadoxa australica]
VSRVNLDESYEIFVEKDDKVLHNVPKELVRSCPSTLQTRSSASASANPAALESLEIKRVDALKAIGGPKGWLGSSKILPVTGEVR